ncbi:MAG: winged helix-turn-helix transcriptional regulator [Thermoplasmatota archaeon]
MKAPLLPLTAFALILIGFGASALSTIDPGSDEHILIEPEEMGVEVLLNGPGISFDLSAFDPFIVDGTVIVPDEGPPDIHQGEATFDKGPDRYLMRARYEPDLGVMIRPEMLPDPMGMGQEEAFTEGLSISIVIPGIAVGTERNMTSFFKTFDYTGPRVETLEERLIDLDFTGIWHYSDDLMETVQFLDGATEIRITMANYTDVPGRTAYITFDVKLISGSLTEDLESRVLSVLDLFGGFPDFWNSSESFEFKDMDYLIKVDQDLDPDRIDWMTTMRTQLLHFTEIGLISGLSREEIEIISSKCEKGTYDTNGRIVYDPGSDDWRSYKDTDMPPYLWEVFGPPETLDANGLPPLIVPNTDSPDAGLSALTIALIVVAIILLLLGSMLYQRIDRAVKLNNIRRKMIYDRVRQNPGIHFSALMKDLDLKPGVASYHINKLEKDEYIKSFQDGMYRRFYLYEERVEMRIMLSDLQKMIVHTIKDEPGISQIDISRALSKSKVVINYHVRFLRDLGLIVLERDGRMTHCFLTPQGSRMSRA